MKRKVISVTLSLILVLSLFLTGAAAASPDRGKAYGNVNKGLDVDLLEELDEDELEVTLRDAGPETGRPLSDLEEEHPAPDIAGNPDEEGCPEPEQGSLEKAVAQAVYLDEAIKETVGGKVYGTNFAALVRQIEGTGEKNAARLSAVVRKLYHFTWRYQEIFAEKEKAAEALVLLTDELMRLTYRYEMNNRVRLNIYQDAARIYSLMGCYRRAVGALELAAETAPDSEDVYKHLKHLYREKWEKKIRVYVRGKRPDFGGVEPVIRNGRTLVPVRGLAEALGGNVEWNGKNKQVTIVNGDVNITLTIGSLNATVNGRNVKLDVPAVIEKGRTLVPLRFVMENMGAKVDYDHESGLIVVL